MCTPTRTQSVGSDNDSLNVALITQELERRLLVVSELYFNQRTPATSGSDMSEVRTLRPYEVVAAIVQEDANVPRAGEPELRDPESICSQAMTIR